MEQEIKNLDKTNIDLVYCWVDNSDTRWQQKFDSYLDSNKNYDPDSIDKCRFSNNNELLYSLRSVEKNAPWIHKIYIITDNQLPKWLNTKNKKIQIVNHKDIIPEEYLPLFNSNAIESRIPFIKGLSEYFLYANDDTFFWNPVDKEFFFEDGKPIFRVEKEIRKRKYYKRLYGSTIKRSYNLVNQKYKLDIVPRFSHHNVDSYRKSLFMECINEFQEEFDKALKNRFRDYSDIQRIIVSYYSLAKGEAVMKKVRLNLLEKIMGKMKDSLYYNLSSDFSPAKILYSNTKLVCLNDSKNNTDKIREGVNKLLQTKFPEKSEFEN